jgi:hypothetical protein
MAGKNIAGIFCRNLLAPKSSCPNFPWRLRGFAPAPLRVPHFEIRASSDQYSNAATLHYSASSLRLPRFGLKRDGDKRIRFCRKCKHEFDKK